MVLAVLGFGDLDDDVVEKSFEGGVEEERLER
jgi:hypothetical protein